MIKGIHVENFKGIGEPGIEIDLKPITLLFGNNSAGKSTIFHALLYAYELFVNRNFNADRTTLGGESVDLGGFHAFVHAHDPSRRVGLAINLDLSSAQLDRQWRISEAFVGSKNNEVDLSEMGTDVWSARIGVSVAWDEQRRMPFVAAFTVEIDEVPLVDIECEKMGAFVECRVNYRHPVFHWPNSSGPGQQPSAGVLDSLYPPFQTVTDQWFWRDGVEVEKEVFAEQPDLVLGDPPRPESDDEMAEYRMVEEIDHGHHASYFYRYDIGHQRAILEGAFFSARGQWSETEAVQQWRQRLELARDDLFKPVQVLDQVDALPPLDRSIQLLIAPSVESETGDLIRDIVSRLALGPAKMLVEQLRRFRHIGPLREVPPRRFQNTLSPDPARWCRGLAGWDVLSVAGDRFVEEVSEWLCSEKHLGTGYSLIRKRYKELEPDGYIMRILAQENPLDDLPIAMEGIERLPQYTRLVLRDDDSLVEVDPPDIAVGITQLVPVIVSALDRHPGITLIEQPELHNHPAIEVGLGDLFIQTIGQEHCRFLLETHGEHLVLRMLRRIREASEGELPEGVVGLSPEDVAVYFVQRTADGVQAKRLRIDETGEFIDRWPQGFFRERAEELF